MFACLAPFPQRSMLEKSKEEVDPCAEQTRDVVHTMYTHIMRNSQLVGRGDQYSIGHVISRTDAGFANTCSIHGDLTTISPTMISEHP